MTKIMDYVCIAWQARPSLTGMNTHPLTLAPGQHWTTRRAGRLLVRCHAGILWITTPGDVRDHVLRTGESLRLDDARGILIGALTPATLDLTSPTPLPDARHAAQAIPG